MSHLCLTTPAPPPPSLDLVVKVPDVTDHGVGAQLQVPGGQGQSGVELLHVGGLSDGRQSVGAAAQQEVTERSVNGGHIWRDERALNLGW